MPASLGLDHLYVRVDDLDALLDLLHRRLALPLIWPVRDETFARYAWVNAGNVGIELWQAASNADLPDAALPCIAGIGLWPQDVHASRAQLAAQGVACKEPRAWHTRSDEGQEVLNFTNCLVLDASGPACQVFFCEWGPQAPVAPWPKGETATQRRRNNAAALADCGGGALGIVGLCALHMESPDPAATARTWEAITGAGGQVAPGVALCLAPGPILQITALVFRVRDTALAARALRDAGIAITARGDAGPLWLDARATFGLALGLLGA